MRQNECIRAAALATILVAVVGCASNTNEPSSTETTTPEPLAAAAQGSFTGEVVETMNAGSYTYVKVDTGTEQIWAAAPAFPTKVGARVTVPPGMAMENFHSDALNRDFELVYFVGMIVPEGAVPAAGQMPPGHPPVGAATGTPEVDLAGIAVAEDGVTVGELYADKVDLAGTQVRIRGKVVKVNLEIMGTNWIHVQDGTGDPQTGTNDLTVTTAAVATVGDTVVVSGELTLDKDFGAGYRYPVIIENATVKLE